MPLLNYSNVTYVGDVVNGEAHGSGTFTWNSGNTYTGDFVNNSQTGEGIFTRPARTSWFWSAASNPSNLPEGQARLHFDTANAQSRLHPRSK